MEKSNINIIGEGSSSGGDYGKVKVTGEAEFFGDIRCESFKCTGNAVLEGALAAGDIKITGTLTLKGNKEAAEGLQQPGIKAEEIKVTGELRIPGNCESEDFKLRGSIEADGTFSAEEIELKLHGHSHVHEMGGTNISVKGGSGISWAHLFMRGIGTLKSRLIEGDRIYLENTEAEYVRGAKVEIGPGCRIGFVEFRETLEIDKNAEVGGQRKA